MAALKQATSFTPSGVQQALKNLSYGPTLAGGVIKFDSQRQAHDNVVNVTFTGTTESTQLLTPAQIQ